MEHTIEAFFAGIARLFTENNFLEIAECYAYPLAVYQNDRITLFNTREEILNLVFDMRATSVRRGVQAYIARVKSISVEQDRCRVLVEWHYLDARGQELALDRVRCFVRVHGDRPQIQLMEFLDLEFPAYREALQKVG